MQRRMIKGKECLHGNERFPQAFFCEAPGFFTFAELTRLDCVRRKTTHDSRVCAG